MNMPATQQQAAPQKQPSLLEMTRMMDVAAEVRKARLTAQQQLNIQETKRLLRERLLESARISGDPVTAAEVDAAIDAYYARLHEFQAPRPGVQTFLASLYVRRATLTKVAITLATIGALVWGVFAWGLVGPKRAQRQADTLLNQTQETVAMIEQLAVVPDLADRAQQLRAEAQQVHAARDLNRLQAINTELAQQAALLREEYTLQIVTGADQQSGVERKFTDASGTRTSGYYLIVEATGPAGEKHPVTITDAETGKQVSTAQWGEQVPEEVFDRVAADKQADGVVDQRQFGQKERGRLAPTLQLPGNDGQPLQRGRQITQW